MPSSKNRVLCNIKQTPQHFSNFVMLKPETVVILSGVYLIDKQKTSESKRTSVNKQDRKKVENMFKASKVTKQNH